jgi:hypothetical protein
MPESQFPASSIALGEGGRVTDPVLLKELAATPVLQPRDLLKLAIHFSAFPTNAHLANVLWEFALETIVQNPIIAEVTAKVFGINIVKFLHAFEKFNTEAEDILEDFTHRLRGEGAEADDESREVVGQNFISVRISGINVLIEKRLLENGEAAFFVVGISPDPNELPNPEDSE